MNNKNNYNSWNKVSVHESIPMQIKGDGRLCLTVNANKDCQRNDGNCHRLATVTRITDSGKNQQTLQTLRVAVRAGGGTGHLQSQRVFLEKH